MVTIPPRILLPLELPVAITLTIVAARTHRPGLLGVAMTFANPVLTAQGLLALAAVPRLAASAPALEESDLGGHVS